MKKILFVIFCCITSLNYSVDSVSIELATKEEDRAKMGLSSLTDDQKVAFEQWLGDWTKRVIQTAPSYHPALSLNQWISSWPASLQVNPPKDSSKNKSDSQNKTTIYRNIDGEKLILNDGSEWEINSQDQYMTRYWTRETKLQITESTRENISRPYSITNSETGELVGAKKLKDATTGPKESSNYFRGTFQLHGISATGDEIRLINNSRWKIAPIDQQKIITTWKVHDRIRIQESQDAMWPYTLNNLDSGSTAIAIKKD